MGKTAETHVLNIPEVEVRVDVEDDGNVWVHIGGEIISTETLGKIVNFTEKHGEVRIGR
jgi:hypothetical protein